MAGDTNIVIILNELPSQDDSAYQFLSPDPDSASPLNCGNCHAEVLMNQWRSDAHGRSAKNPFFYAMYNGTDIHGNPNIGFGYKLDFPQTNGNCATCHFPIAALSDPWGINPNELTGINLNGISCDFCHKMYKVKPTTGQGTTGILSIEMLRPPEELQVFFGPYDDIHEPDSYLPLMGKSEYCAPCHTGKFWGIPAYNCFPEWQQSPYPALDIQCQNCHMVPDGVTTNFAPGKGGLERDPLTIPSHLMPGSRDPQILANSVTMTLKAEQIGDSIKVMVTIYNDKTGHHVPTGRAERNMILLVEVKDDNSTPMEFLKGETVPDWGGEGSIENGDYARLPGKGFAKILADNLTGLFPAPVWRPTNIVSDNRIAAFETDTSYYYFKIPRNSSRLTVNAKLIYRRFFKEWMDEKQFNIPDIVMENESLNLTVSPTSVAQDKENLDDLYSAFQNYPNPFNAVTSIRAKLNRSCFLKLILYDISGKEIRTYIDGYFEQGNHEFTLELSNMSSGVYFFKLVAGSRQFVRKILLLK